MHNFASFYNKAPPSILWPDGSNFSQFMQYLFSNGPRFAIHSTKERSVVSTIAEHFFLRSDKLLVRT